MVAPNQEIIGHGELYASKYNAERGAETVRRIVRELTAVSASDDDIRVAVEAAADGLLYTSEGDYPFLWVHAGLDGETAVTEQLVREKMAAYVDGDPDADKPLAQTRAATVWPAHTTGQRCPSTLVDELLRGVFPEEQPCALFELDGLVASAPPPRLLDVLGGRHPIG